MVAQVCRRVAVYSYCQEARDPEGKKGPREKENLYGIVAEQVGAEMPSGVRTKAEDGSASASLSDSMGQGRAALLS